MPIYKINKKKDGKQGYRVIFCYTDNTGKAKNVERVVYGAQEAKDKETELIQEYKKAPTAVDAPKTLQALYDEYIREKTHIVRETTLDKTKQYLKRYVLPYLKDIKLSKFNAKILDEWKNTISELTLQKKSSQNRTTLAVTTKQNIYRELRTLFNYAVDKEYIPRNPLHNVNNFKDPYEIPTREKIRYYTPDEFKQYITVAKQIAEASDSLTDWGYYVFFCIAFYTGMRKGEINALKWSDDEKNYIHVRRSIAQKLKGGDRETPPKNKSSYRTLQKPLPLIKILQEHKDRQKKLKGFTEDFRICGGIAALRDTSIDYRNRKFAELASLKRIRVHDFRHTHATVLINEGINIQEIARRLGHSKVEITWNTYAHLYPREEERAVKILNKIK